MLSRKLLAAFALLTCMQAPSAVQAGKIKDTARAVRDGAIRFGHASKEAGKAIAHGVAWPVKKTYAAGIAGYHKAGELVSRVATGISSTYTSTYNRIEHMCESFHRTFESPMTTEEIRTTIQELNRQSRTMITFLGRLDEIATQPIELAAGTTAELYVGTQLHENQQNTLFFNLILTTMRKTPALAEQLTASNNNIQAFIALIRQQALTYGFTTIDQLDEIATNLHLDRLVHGDVLARTLPLLKKLAIGGIIVITASGIAYLVFTAIGLPAIAGVTLIPLQLIISIFGKLLRLPITLTWQLLVGIWYLIAGNNAFQEQAIALFNECITGSLPQTSTGVIITSVPTLLNATTTCMRLSLGQ